MNNYCGLLVIGYNLPVAAVDSEVQRVKSGLVGEQFDEINRLLQVGSLFVGINHGAVDIDEPVAEIMAQALTLVRHEIRDCYAYDEPQQSHHGKNSFQ